MKKMLMLMLTLTLTFAVCTAMAMTPGTYIGTADARGGMMTVEVTVTEDKIESIVVKEHADTIGICEPPIAMIPADIIAYQSLDVDTVAGATLTSYGVINAVTDALKQAGADIDALQGCRNREAASGCRGYADAGRRRWRRHGRSRCGCDGGG